jgi:hypothetical protein
LEKILLHPGLLVGRHRELTPAVQAFVIQLVRCSETWFGTPLYGSVATIARVLFQLEKDVLPVSLVRSWAKPHVAETEMKAHSANRAAADRRAARALTELREIREKGATGLRGIAAALNARGVPTARGRKWHRSTVSNLLAREQRERS